MEKIERLRSAFDEAGIDGILLTNEHSRRYMANFTGTAGVVLISKKTRPIYYRFPLRRAG